MPLHLFAPRNKATKGVVVARSVGSDPQIGCTRASCTRSAVLGDCWRFEVPDDPGVREVVSAFNGAALYKREFLDGCRYVGKAVPEEKDSLCSCAHHEVCEHVSLHRGIRKNGGAVAVLKSFTIFSELPLP